MPPGLELGPPSTAAGPADRVGEGAGWARRHRELSAQLSSGWPEADRRRCRAGLGLLARYRSLRVQLGFGLPPRTLLALGGGLDLLVRIEAVRASLSVPFAELDAQEIHDLRLRWHRAKRSAWPLSWLRERKVTRALARAAQGEGPLDAGGDVRKLATLRRLLDEVDALDLGALTEGLWAGRRTQVDDARGAVAFQAALAAALEGRPWQDAGLQPVAEGHCGDRMAKQLVILRKMAAVETELRALDDLAGVTGGLWQGLETRREWLEAALAFQEDLDRIRVSGVLTGLHPLIRSGECGAALAQDFHCLRERMLVDDAALAS